MKQAITLVGTGLSGLTLAAALTTKGFDIDLIGPEPKAADDGRSTAILAPNISFLKSVGLWPLGEATPLLRMELVDRGETFSFDCHEMDLPEFGFNIANKTLKNSLLKAVTKNRRITWHKTTLKDARRTPNGWTVLLADKMKIDTTLLIGADGRHSAVRKAADIVCNEKDNNQAALVVTLEAEKPHFYTTVERYRSGGPFTLVPCPEDRLALVWCDDEDILKEKITLPPSELAAEITSLSEKRFGKLTAVTKPQIWPVRPMKAQQLVAAHTVLVGEAAHVLPPIGAQGFNASLSDMATLAQTLAKGKSLGLPAHDFTLLSDYARHRQADIAARYHGITTLNNLIRNDTPVARQIRRIALRGLTKIAPLKRKLMQFGLGEAA